MKMPKNFTSLLKKIGLSSKWYRKPAFNCSWYPMEDKICLAIYLGAQNIHILLTKQQWKNFKIFLKKTITQKKFPEDHQGFSGFDITTNKAIYYCNSRELRISEKIKKGSRLAKERIKLKREKDDVLKNRLTKKLDINFNQITITLTRNTFYSFRKEILQ